MVVTTRSWSRPGARLAIALLIGSLVLAQIVRPLALVVEALLQRGAEPRTVEVLLLAPLAVTIIVFLRVVVGLDTLGIFAPMLLAIAFLRIGVIEGLLLLAVLVIVCAPCIALIERYRFLAISRTGVVICLVAVTLLIATAVGALVGSASLLEAEVIPLAIMAGVIERFVNAQADQRPEETAKLIFTGVVAALVSLVLANQVLQRALFARPDLLLLSMPACLLMGRYAGLRLLDLLCFREVAARAAR